MLSASLNKTFPSFDALCYLVNVSNTYYSEDNRSFLDSLEYLNVSHFSITSNGLSIEEEAIENPLGVLPYQFEPKFDRDILSFPLYIRHVTIYTCV